MPVDENYPNFEKTATSSSLHHHFIITSSSSLHHHFIITSSSLHHHFIITSSSLHHHHFIITSSSLLFFAEKLSPGVREETHAHTHTGNSLLILLTSKDGVTISHDPWNWCTTIIFEGAAGRKAFLTALGIDLELLIRFHGRAHPQQDKTVAVLPDEKKTKKRKTPSTNLRPTRPPASIILRHTMEGIAENFTHGARLKAKYFDRLTSCPILTVQFNFVQT
jgi:hypothetical protein